MFIKLIILIGLNLAQCNYLRSKSMEKKRFQSKTSEDVVTGACFTFSLCQTLSPLYKQRLRKTLLPGYASHFLSDKMWTPLIPSLWLCWWEHYTWTSKHFTEVWELFLVTMRRPSVRPVSLLLTCFWFVFGCSAIDTITSTHFIRDPETIVSSGRVFKLGFFSLDGSSNRYVGIWYNTTSLLTIIWVANRDRPLNDSSGVLTISEDGNIQVLNGRKEILWSSNVSNPAGVNSSAQLQDSGNLVLRDNNGVSVWESLQNPSHSFVPQMKISTNTRTGVRKVLTSWKSSSDPSMGSFTAGVEPLNIPQVFIWNGSRPYWRSGPWDGQILTGVDVKWITLDGLNIVDDKEGTVYITFAYPDSGFFYAYVLTPEGILVETSRDKRNEDWERVWTTKENECEIYGKCGPFGHCNSRDSPICSCLKGYEPKHTQEWNRGNWTGGCVRKTPLQCERTKNGSEEAKVDGFLKLTNMKVPDFAEQSYALEDDCRQQCLRNCSCIAYSYYTGIGCMWWSGDLIDIQKLSSTGAHLFIRVAHSELKQGNIF